MNQTVHCSETPPELPFCTFTAEIRHLLKNRYLEHGFSQDSVRIFDRISLVYDRSFLVEILGQSDDFICDSLLVLEMMIEDQYMVAGDFFISDLKDIIRLQMGFFPGGTC